MLNVQPLAQLDSVEEECLQQIFKSMFDSVLDKACTAAGSCHHWNRVDIPSAAFSTPFWCFAGHPFTFM